MQGVPVSKTSTIISKEWKKVKANDKKMKKYKDLYKEEKQQHEETLLRYQEDHMDKMEIINLHKKCNKTDTKAVTKTARKVPKSRYHLFLREQLDEMTGEDRKNYQSIVSRRWKEVKEDPARLSAYNDRARQVKNEVEELADESQNEKMVVDRPAVRLLQKAPKIPKFVDTDLDGSDDEQESVVKKPQKASKSPEFVDTDSSTEDAQEPVVRHLQKAPKIPKFVDIDSSIEDEQGPIVKQPQKASKTLGLIDTGPDDKDPQETSPGPVHKEPAKPVKRLPAANCTPTASCTHILTSGVRKGKQWRLKGSDMTGKFCNYHKRQT